VEPAYIVTDLGFGDAGKGLLVDHLVRRTGARWVVRHGGGAQAGHNVITSDGRHHCFAQFGAGSFVPGTRTHLSRHFLLHPTALLVEARVLADVGVADALERVEVDERALVITPYHQAACRLRELLRGDTRHGSCGVGIGEVVSDAMIAGDDALRAGDLRDAVVTLRLAERARERLLSTLGAARMRASNDARIHEELMVFEDASLATRWVESTRAFADSVTLADANALNRHLAQAGAVVFEGAQGVLLDQDWGFHPHTTWSRTTSANARTLLAEACPGRPIVSLGVMRSYAIRHGAGPMPSEAIAVPLDRERERHNPSNAWQDSLRTGALDLVLLRYALEVEGDVNGLVVTHMDVLAGHSRWPLVTGYEDDAGFTQRLPVAKAPSLKVQSALGRRLAMVHCRVAEVAESPSTSVEDVLVARLESELCVQVLGRAQGPTADDLHLQLKTEA